MVDNYIAEEAGQNLEQLSLGVGADGNTCVDGAADSLRKLFAGDPSLENTVIGLLERGNTKSDFQVSFEFANGTLSDPATLEMAKSKIEGIKEELMGGWDPKAKVMKEGIVDQVRKQLELMGGDYEKEFMDALARGFSITVNRGGGFEITGADDMSPKMKDVLEGLVQKALDSWAEGGTDAMDGGGVRVANFADVVDTFIEQHRFEHGDVDQYEHLLEINFAGGPSDSAKVISPEADKAQDEKNKQVAGELGTALKDMLSKDGIDTNGLEFEIDEDGKITVLGDPANENVSRAQTLLDKFCEETKATTKVANNSAKRQDKEDTQAAGNERRDILLGKAEEGDDDHVPEGYAKRDVVTSGDKMLREEANRDWAKRVNDGDMIAAWERTFPKNEKVETHFLGSVSGGVSAITQPMYAVTDIFSGDSSRSEAMRKYVELLNGMGGFHDGRKSMKYSLTGE